MEAILQTNFTLIQVMVKKFSNCIDKKPNPCYVYESTVLTTCSDKRGQVSGCNATGKAEVGDRDMNRITTTVCNELAISSRLTWLLSRWGPEMLPLAVSCHLQNDYDMLRKR